MTRFEDPLRVKYGQLDVTDHPYIFAADVDFGAGENLYEALAGLLADGESVTSPRTSNREFSFGVWVEGPTLDQIEDPEMALIAEAERPRNELTVWPGDNGTPFVLETFRAQVEHERTDARERAGMRLIVLTVKALPFVRAVEPTISEPMSAPVAPVAPVVITVDTCDSTTGWTAKPAPIATAGGHVYNSTWATLSSGVPAFYAAVSLTRTGSITRAGTPYLIVEWARERKDWSSIWTPPIIVFNGGTTSARAIQTSTLDATWARSIYLMPTTVATMEFRTPVEFTPHRLNIRDIKRTDQIPAPRTTGHQLSRTIEIGGSARTQASMHVWIDLGSLGDVLVYTSTTPDGMFSCDPYLPASVGVPVAGTVTGTEKSLASGISYPVPASLFDPDKSTGYMILARLRRSGSGAITTSVQARRDTLGSGPANVGTPEVQVVTPPSMPSHGYVSLGLFNMPPRRVQGRAAVMQVTVQGADAVLDDLWFVDVETGSLTWVNSASASHLWIDSPTLDSPLPRVRASLSWDGEGGWELEPVSMGRHDFPPGPLHIYTVATLAESSKIQLEYFERGLLHLRR